MGHIRTISEGIYLIGGPDISRFDDAASFIVDFNGELVMIDAGAGGSSKMLQENMEDGGLDPKAISTLILTHNHIDHIGSAPFFRKHFNCLILIHELDADALEEGDPVRTAASCYGTTFPPTKVDRKLKGDHEVLVFGSEELHCLHTPGHTPGSISIYLDRGGKRILFGQDIHGPFLPSFKSNVTLWRRSMEKLLALNADILCEGHYGIFSGRERAAAYIRSQLRQLG